jgi:hypothetical protein
MADFILGRLKFKFQGAWTASTPYIKDDVVRVGGRCYVCIDNHTSAAAFATDAGESWDLMVDGMAWRGAWASSTPYEINDIVNHSSSAYICNEAHTSGAAWLDNSDKFDSFSG